MGFSPATLLAAGEKHEAAELLVLIVVPLALSVVLWRIVEARISKGGSRDLRWAALVPLIAGVLLALRPLKDIRDDVYRMYFDVSDRSVSLHFASFFVPLTNAVLLTGWIVWKAREHKLEG